MTDTDWPTISCTPTMTDDDVDFHSDVIYLRDLLQDLWIMCACHRARSNPFPANLSRDLDTLEGELAWLKREMNQ